MKNSSRTNQGKHPKRSESDIQAEISFFAKIPLNQELPIAKKSKAIQKLLSENQVVIIAGETGCGKTTQLPQICLQAGLGIRKQIAHTQPRRVAATSVASRIASELKTELGNTVGYAVRFSDKTSAQTRIKLMTDGVLLAELQSDPMLSRYEVIIVDEAHERSLNIDFLLGFLKQLLKKRSDLKVIVTSATIDLESFSRYFYDAPIISVEGRTYPVEVLYQPISDVNQDENNDKKGGSSNPDGTIENSVVEAIDQCIAHSTGDILIFSHGEAEIRQLTKHIQKQNYSQLTVLPLYARLGIKEQQAIFASNSKRKVIISTNVAETSLTIPNILFVIDIGQARISRYSQRNKIQQLPVEKISQASANQRKGRSGRIAPGICIRLYAEDDFDNRPEYTEPEIKRTNLSSVVLRLKSLGVKDVESFPFIQSPNERQWKVAFNLLFEIGAMDNNQQITSIGKQMSRLPIDPQLARILLDKNNQALNEMLIIASFLGVRDVRIRPPKDAAKGAQQKADLCHQNYHDKNSDIISIINLWKFLNSQKETLTNSMFRRWCQDNFINFVGWLEWRNVHYQVKDQLKQLSNTSDRQGRGQRQSQEQSQEKENEKPKEKVFNDVISATDDEIHQALIPGFVSHLLMKTPEGHYLGARGLKVWIHPSSALFKNKSPWLLSTEMVETNKLYARANVPMKPEWFEQNAKHLLKNNYQDIHWRKNRGHVAAFLNQSLFGLPIVHKRLIEYGKIDPIVGRELFIKEGLVENEINMRFPFLDSNQCLVDEIKLEEEKLRRNDLLIEASSFSKLYDKQIPAGIVNSHKLKRWLKKDWNARNELLSFEKKQLILNQIEALEDYPSEVLVKGVILPVSYRFAPGKEEDGVHISIPKEMLSQFSEKDFEWLVPGYLKDKIAATLKNLPKVLRKKLIPISNTADACVEHIVSFDYHKQDYKRTLKETLLRVKAVDVQLNEIDCDNLPVHLKMKFVCVDVSSNNKNNSTSNYYTSLSHIQKQFSGSKSNHKNSTRNNSSSFNQEKENNNGHLNGWPNIDFAIESSYKSGNQQVRLFNAIADKNSYCQIEQCASLKSAQSVHIKGVARLILIENSNLVKEIKSKWPDRKEFEKLCIRFGGFKVLIDWIALSQIIQSLSKVKMIESQQDYSQFSSQIKNQLRVLVAEQLTIAKPCLMDSQRIYFNLSGLKSDVFKNSKLDIIKQLNTLWQEDNFLQRGAQVFQDYLRYQLGISSRIKRIDENFPRESKILQGWLEWLEWWEDFDTDTLDFEACEKHRALYWLLEEYRISLFAVNIKTQGKISSNKLQKEFELLEQLIS